MYEYNYVCNLQRYQKFLIFYLSAVCKVEELYTYTENKAKFGKPIRRKFFHEGLIQLEQELKNDRNKSANISDRKGKWNLPFFQYITI